MATSEELEVKLDESIKKKAEEPRRWKVIMVNDDRTPMDFVVSVLVEIFNHTPESAEKITMEIHTEGSGLAGVYSFEIAEVKAVETTNLARTNGFPLQVRLEEE